MGIARAYSLFKQVEEIFKCPACHTKMAFKNQNSLICSSGHCFDLSKHGYINFVPNQSKTKYTINLFESRRQIFKSGFYDPLKSALNSLVNKQLYTSVLDAGCGEGFFTSNLADDDKHIFAMDIQKEAIVLAAKENKGIKWLVGDLANIPLKPDSIDILINVFSPANYSEFLRVMRIDGLIIKVIPGSRYLIELRECAKAQLDNKEYSNENVLKCFCDNITLTDKQHIFYQLPVNQDQLENITQMTPLMFNIDRESIKLDDIAQITIDVEIIVGKKSNI